MELLSTEELIAWAIQRRTPMTDKISKEQLVVQDESDGLLFFHTHSVWEAIMKLEKFYECSWRLALAPLCSLHEFFLYESSIRHFALPFDVNKTDNWLAAPIGLQLSPLARS